MSNVRRPMQTGGVCHVWRSPDGEFKHLLLKLDLEYEPDGYAGILVITDELGRNAQAMEVANLRKELPAVLARSPEGAVAYWSLRRDERERKLLLAGLTERPYFVG